VSSERPPEQVLDLARARRDARAARDWPEADRLRDAIEGTGWKVVDRGVDFELSRAHPPDLEEAGRIRYGSSASVPSRLAEPATKRATVLLIVSDWSSDLSRALAGLALAGEEGVQVVVVANAPSDELEEVFEQPDVSTVEPEVVRTSARLGHAAALNAGIRRSIGEGIVILDPSIEPRGAFVGALTRALEDPAVAVAGPWGLASGDLRHFEEVTEGDVEAIEGYCQAFRRSDYAERGPLDEHFRFYRNLDIWWSLVLREAQADEAPRKARVVAELPLARHEHREYAATSPEERDRLSRRNFYRIIDRFRNSRELARSP
jgi:hypothetical protein